MARWLDWKYLLEIFVAGRTRSEIFVAGRETRLEIFVGSEVIVEAQLRAISSANHREACHRSSKRRSRNRSRRRSRKWEK